MSAFQLAVRLGATGVESDVWLTSDGVPVLDHDGVVRGRWRRQRIRDLPRGSLPDHIPVLEEVAELADQHRMALSLDIKDHAALDAVRRTVGNQSKELLDRSYFCFEDFQVLCELAPRFRDVHLVDSSRLSRIKEGPERRLATLADLGVRALNMHQTDWNGGLVTMAHRFDVLAFGWDAQFDYTLTSLLRMGIDGVFSDWVDRMVDAARAEATNLQQ